MQPHSTSGVYYLPRLRKYKVAYSRNCVKYYFGLYDTLEEAERAKQESLAVGPENYQGKTMTKQAPEEEPEGHIPMGISWNKRDKVYMVRLTHTNEAGDKFTKQVGSKKLLSDAKRLLAEEKEKLKCKTTS